MSSELKDTLVSPEEFTLSILLRDYRDTSEKIIFQCAEVDRQIRELIEVRNMISKPYQERLIELESKIRPVMLERKSSFDCDFGKVTYRRGAVRRSWDLDALDQISNYDTYIKERIWAFRKETIGEPSISIKIQE